MGAQSTAWSDAGNATGAESKAIVGTACCANADGATNSISPASQCLMSSSPVFVALVVGEHASRWLFDLHVPPAS